MPSGSAVGARHPAESEPMADHCRRHRGCGRRAARRGAVHSRVRAVQPVPRSAAGQDSRSFRTTNQAGHLHRRRSASVCMVFWRSTSPNGVVRSRVACRTDYRAPLRVADSSRDTTMCSAARKSAVERRSSCGDGPHGTDTQSDALRGAAAGNSSTRETGSSRLRRRLRPFQACGRAVPAGPRRIESRSEARAIANAPSTSGSNAISPTSDNATVNARVLVAGSNSALRLITSACRNGLKKLCGPWMKVNRQAVVKGRSFLHVHFSGRRMTGDEIRHVHANDSHHLLDQIG
jgi:hypothetical protein